MCLQYKSFENKVGKGEIAVYHCFRDVSADKSFENTVGKGEIARNEQFLIFPQCFLTI